MNRYARFTLEDISLLCNGHSIPQIIELVDSIFIQARIHDRLIVIYLPKDMTLDNIPYTFKWIDIADFIYSGTVLLKGRASISEYYTIIECPDDIWRKNFE